MATTMNHPYHLQHPIVLKREGRPCKCSGCKELGFGPRYHCSKRDCPFILHDHCATARPTDRPRIHAFMGNRPFEFLWAPPAGPYRRYCDACGRDVRGFLYHDQSRHGFDLHPCCINLRRTMSDSHGTMELSLKDKVDYTCVKCKRKDLDNVQSKEPFRGWSYVSSCGNYCYHVYCVKTLILENWETGYFNVSSSSSSLVTISETTNSVRRMMPNRSSITSATSSSAMERRSLARPGVSSTKVLIKMAKVGFNLIMSVVLGNPTPLFDALVENLVN
ncbi:protein VACUOLELESS GAMETOPHYTES-like [Prosopis cineraria]|uniref:protein VACUOLELESS GAMETOPHYTES-like n=1 Tax=Prosopis cineraria TaxID=364024 RepID=UPI0024104F3B|nr:protein VACUOLELESS GAMETOPHYTES-like [Prosopis cineraria]